MDIGDLGAHDAEEQAVAGVVHADVALVLPEGIVVSGLNDGIAFDVVAY